MVGILGSRQCGKTTLARDYIAARSEPRVHYFDAERIRAAPAPRRFAPTGDRPPGKARLQRPARSAAVRSASIRRRNPSASG